MWDSSLHQYAPQRFQLIIKIEIERCSGYVLQKRTLPISSVEMDFPLGASNLHPYNHEI